MQCMISHETPLPPCAAGHTARHMLDKRRPAAGGGHNIECKCSRTARHDSFDAALREWCQTLGIAVPVQVVAQFQLAAPEAAPDIPPAPAVVTTLNSMQREAMRRARQGDFELADAMELLSVGRMRGGHRVNGTWHEHDLQYGIWIGGRLQAFAYGTPFDCADEDGDDDSDIDTQLVLDLNGQVLYRAIDQDIPDAYVTGRSPAWAHGVIEAYREQIAPPQQQTFFSSEAA